MAFKPSMRRSGQTLDMELDIKPVMNLMVVLIPLLLAGVEMVKLSIIEIDLPPSKAGSGGASEENPDKEKEKKLGLKIAIVREGISLATAGAVMSGESGEGPTIPRSGDEDYNYDLLKEKLVELKKLIKDKGFLDENRAVITAAANVEYQVIVEVMDNLQTYENEDKDILLLFPEIHFSKII